MNKIKYITWIAVLLGLAGCDSFVAAPYSISANNDVALKSTLGTTRVGIGTFTMAKKFDPGCRLVGPIQLPNDLSFEGYIQNSFADELKVAGLYDENAPIMLQGVIDDLSFSSTGGTWDFALTLKSSNGKSIMVAEHYDFHTSYSAASACHNTSDAFEPAVQALVGKAISAPDFQSLLQH